jgi:hypothetical protein
MGASSPEGFEPKRGHGPYRGRLESGLRKRGYRFGWRRDDWDGEGMPIARLQLKVFDEGGCVVKEPWIMWRSDRGCESAIAESICELLIAGDRRAGEPIRYG